MGTIPAEMLSLRLDIVAQLAAVLDDDYAYLLHFGLATRPNASAATSRAGLPPR